MEYRNLGRSGLRVSAVGLGCNNLSRPGTASESQEGSTALVHAALDAGVTFFDTADIYGAEFGRSEEMLGRALGSHRDEVVIATKWGHSGYQGPVAAWQDKGSRRYLRLAVEDSLRRLGTEWIDLYQLHTPDPNTPIEETLQALDELVLAGKIRYAGSSNLAAWQVVEAELTSRLGGITRFVSAQNEYSLLVRDAERELLPVARQYGIGFLPYFPLYNGIFTGKYSRDGGPQQSRIIRQKPGLLSTVPWDAYDRFEQFGADRGLTVLEATMGWLLAVSGLASVIAGATTPDQVRQNAATSGAWQPTAEELALIGEIFP
ncbi:aldo/keto reductase [Naasia aerilata]|uniref:Oxidoreductase n=1 Tax=Naasia aerilata TaxID=1162966 RepID=A0ABN6XKT0_9MICO|nr:aldo/keto reductase [Naasia aerilata]BDZ44206.1 oxidoreductase [Naasia aerilata]